MLVIALSVALLASLIYNFKLIRRLHAYEQVWQQIEQAADHNEDGNFTINIQHMDEHRPGIQPIAREAVSEPSIRILDLDDLAADDTPPRAA
jgi:hypothetical protein